MATSINVTALSTNDKTYSRAISYVNPNASDIELKQFATGVIGLTTSTLTKIDRIDKDDITNAAAKPKLSLTLYEAAMMPLTERNADAIFAETYLPSFTYTTEANANETLMNVSVCAFIGNNGYVSYSIGQPSMATLPADSWVKLTLYFEETDTTAATTAIVQFNYNTAGTLTIL